MQMTVEVTSEDHRDTCTNAGISLVLVVEAVDLEEH